MMTQGSASRQDSSSFEKNVGPRDGVSEANCLCGNPKFWGNQGVDLGPGRFEK